MKHLIENFTYHDMPVSSASRIPASEWQRHYWAQAMLARQGTTLNIAMRWRIDGRISEASIEKALQALFHRHEVLRTRFKEEHGTLFQDPETGFILKLSTIDLQTLPAEARDKEALRLGEDEAQKPFSIESEPLMRAMFIRLQRDSGILHLTFHHLIVDGWSIGILLREFSKLASGFESGEAATLPPVDLHYADYTLWQNDILESGVLNEEQDYWLAKLSELPRFEVPATRLRSDLPGKGEIRSILLPRSLTDALDAIARAQGQTLFSISMASLAIALYSVTGQSEAIIGTQVAARETNDEEKVIGPLLNRLVLRFDMDGNAPFRSLSETVRDAVQEAFAHQRLPFPVLANILDRDSDRSRRTLYSINFVLQKESVDGEAVNEDDNGLFKLTSLPSHPVGPLWDLSFFMVEREVGWRISCEANTAMYDAAVADSILTLWRTVFESVVKDYDRPIGDMVSLPHPRARDTASEYETSLWKKAAGPARVKRKTPRQEALAKRIEYIQPDGKKTPVVVLNNTAMLYVLSNYLGADRPCIEIQFPPANEKMALPERHFADIARDAVEMVRLARPHGPYILLGLCVFGSVALEAARLLREEGEDVPLVVLNDSWAPGYREDMPWLHRKLRKARVVRSSIAHDWRLYRSRSIPLTRFLSFFTVIRKTGFISAALKLGLLKPDPDGDLENIERRWFTDYLQRSQSKYRPPKYDGNVLVLRSRQALKGRFFAHSLGWDRIVTGRLEVVECPAIHAEMFRKQGAEVMAKSINAVMAEFEAAS